MVDYLLPASGAWRREVPAVHSTCVPIVRGEGAGKSGAWDWAGAGGGSLRLENSVHFRVICFFGLMTAYSSASVSLPTRTGPDFFFTLIKQINRLQYNVLIK